MSTRHGFPVSVKAAVFNSRNELLMIRLTHVDAYGMPGGHMEEGETPDEAMERELQEETGLRDCDLKRVDFFLHEGEGKIVLAYTGKTNELTLKSDQGDLEGVPVWVPRTTFGVINTHPSYRVFVNKIWPE